MRTASMTILVAVCLGASTLARSQEAAKERAIPIDPGFGIDLHWFDGSACNEAVGDRFYFRVGDQDFVIEKSRVVWGRLKKIDIASTAPNRAFVPAGAGCSTEPLPLAEAELVPRVEDLSNRVLMTEAPERTEHMSPTAKYLEFLGTKGQCKTTERPQVVTCVGSRTQDGKSIALLFMVLTQPDNRIQLLASGSPVHARCEELGEAFPCVVISEAKNRVTLRSPVDPKMVSADLLQRTNDALIRLTDSLAR